MSFSFDFAIFGRGRALADFGFLGVDVHNHVLPGIDDGAADVTTSVALVRALGELGFGTLYPTPHIMLEPYANGPCSIAAAHAEAREAVTVAGLPTCLAAPAAEYLLDEGFADHLEQGALLTLPGRRVLVEWSPVAEPVNLLARLAGLRKAGYTPLLAHPERYAYWQSRPTIWREMVAQGCELQLNLTSLVGYYGRGAQRAGHALLRHRLIAFAGTDCHNLRQLAALKRVLADRSAVRALRRSRFANAELASVAATTKLAAREAVAPSEV